MDPVPAQAARADRFAAPVARLAATVGAQQSHRIPQIGRDDYQPLAGLVDAPVR
jgi:hypothetical protein